MFTALEHLLDCPYLYNYKVFTSNNLVTYDYSDIYMPLIDTSENFKKIC